MSQASLASGEEFTKKCPFAKCRNTPRCKLKIGGSASYKEEFQQLRDELLHHWAEYSQEQRVGKGTRLARLACCKPCESERDLSLFTKKMLEDLGERHAAGTLSPVKMSASHQRVSTSTRSSTQHASPQHATRRGGGPPPVIDQATEDLINDLKQKLNLSRQKAKALEVELVKADNELEHVNNQYNDMKQVVLDLEDDAQQVMDQDAGRTYRKGYIGYQRAIKVAVEKMYEVADGE